ncbi:DedA family protein [Corallococcus aberystwythensis]|uniref:DedA family protein n=1 Tax=Corallococcus aberystwythensis TaxID=2316722 RepID=A0A3A8QPY4_9BACT|nr:DedA family protein [Corallococcus aberystwythensis]RKH70849.1 DedA family protein [Corallococcus aberystwythensis]
MTPSPLQLLLTHGSGPLVFAVLVAGGLGLPFPEDLVQLAAGVLSHRGAMPLPAAIAVCFAGVLCGDTVLFLMARRLGQALYTHRRTRRLFPPERREHIQGLYAKHGSRVVFAGRFLSVLRVPVFAMAAAEGMPLRRFLLWDGLALCVSSPLVVTLGYVGSASVDRVAKGVGRVEHFVALAGVAALLVALAVRHARERRQPRPST